MGNCCCPQSNEDPGLKSGLSKNQSAFQGEGHRLGTANSTKDQKSAYAAPTSKDEIPQPIVDANLTEEEREIIRNDRAAAAEARLKKMGGTSKPKKKPSSDAPLRGPNTQPTMTWTTG